MSTPPVPINSDRRIDSSENDDTNSNISTRHPQQEAPTYQPRTFNVNGVRSSGSEERHYESYPSPSPPSRFSSAPGLTLSTFPHLPSPSPVIGGPVNLAQQSGAPTTPTTDHTFSEGDSEGVRFHAESSDGAGGAKKAENPLSVDVDIPASQLNAAALNPLGILWIPYFGRSPRASRGSNSSLCNSRSVSSMGEASDPGLMMDVNTMLMAESFEVGTNSSFSRSMTPKGKDVTTGTTTMVSLVSQTPPKVPFHDLRQKLVDGGTRSRSPSAH